MLKVYQKKNPSKKGFRYYIEYMVTGLNLEFFDKNHSKDRPIVSFYRRHGRLFLLSNFLFYLRNVPQPVLQLKMHFLHHLLFVRLLALIVCRESTDCITLYQVAVAKQDNLNIDYFFNLSIHKFALWKTILFLQYRCHSLYSIYVRY